ncbi:hypothetical protein GF361_04760 [Candidatus Woesearchaeota archaeon]|nr:hypothetical protein [Candidatus Woesearchaeota archaeon]
MEEKKIDKEIYKGILNFDKGISISLSFFIIIAGSVGLFLLSREGITGFSILNLEQLDIINMGIIFFLILFVSIILALVNIIYLGKISKEI